MRTETLRDLIPVAAGIGLIVSLFAAYEILNPASQSVCSISAFISCSAVDKSGKTTTLGVPDWAWGVGGFVGLLFLAGMANRTADIRWERALLLWASAGVVLSVYLAYIELFEINALCLVCFSAYVAGFVVWGSAIALVRAPKDLLEEDAYDQGETELMVDT